MLRLAVEWLDALDVPAGDRSHEDIEAARPAGAVDVCLTPDGVRHEGGDELYEPGTPCTEAYPVHCDPRTAVQPGQPPGWEGGVRPVSTWWVRCLAKKKP